MLSGSSEQDIQLSSITYGIRQKQTCDRKSVLPEEQHLYIKEKVLKAGRLDGHYGRKEMTIDCSYETLYRQF